MEQKEIWKPVVGFEGYYEVSNLGRVFSVKTGRILKQVREPRGYCHVTLSVNKQKVTRSTHRLIAQAFLPNPDNLPQINHKNEVKWDNRAENLEWCNVLYNVNFGTRNERISELKKRPIEQYTRDGVFVASYDSILQAQEKTGIRKQEICHAAKGRRKTAGGFQWRYAKKSK